MDCKKCTLLTFILMACFYTGIIFGYAPLLLMLEKEGVYIMCKPAIKAMYSTARAL